MIAFFSKQKWVSHVALIFLLLALLEACDSEVEPDQKTIAVENTLITVTPAASDALLQNPGMGIESFHRYVDAQTQQPTANLPYEDYPDTTMEYYRFYWAELEPKEGEYNFALIDNILTSFTQHPKRRLALRFMTLAGPYDTNLETTPQWLIDKGIQGEWVADHKIFVPDLDDPIFLQYVDKFFQAFGQRYDGNPLLHHMDIGMVGAWGEWHLSEFADMFGLPQILDHYTQDTLNHYVDIHFQYFPNTPKIMLINGHEALPYANRKGAGWRADCWGDWHHFSPNWSHMTDSYPEKIDTATEQYSNFLDTWQKAPIALEICGDAQQWESEFQYTLAEIQKNIDFALKYHASSLNFKSKPIPAQYRPLIDDALTKIGYRFRVKQLRHAQTITRQADSDTQHNALDITWINEGVAHIYHPYQVSMR